MTKNHEEGNVTPNIDGLRCRRVFSTGGRGNKVGTVCGDWQVSWGGDGVGGDSGLFWNVLGRISSHEVPRWR